MDKYPIQRTDILAALKNSLEPFDFVYAMWEGGAASFNRVDQWSDLDIQIDAEDSHAAETMAIVEQILSQLCPIKRKFELPQPTWHGHLQTFFQLEQASPFEFIDLVVIQHSNSNKFLEKEIHGQALVHFDKCKVVHADPVDPEEMVQKILQRLETMKITFEMFQVLTWKEIYRGNAIEAISYYQSMTIRPLVEALRMLYAPWHYNFHTRYVYYEFPKEVVRRLEPFFYPTDLQALKNCLSEANQWFQEITQQITSEKIRQNLLN